MVAVIGVLSLLGFIFGMYAGVRSGIIHEYVHFLNTPRLRINLYLRIVHFGVLKPFVICWLGFQTSADILITGLFCPFIFLPGVISSSLLVSLTFVLSRSRTGFRKTDTIINRLIRGAIQTGLFASIFALADLFSFVLLGKTNLYALFAFPIGRIYTNVSHLKQRPSHTIVDTYATISDFIGYPQCSQSVQKLEWHDGCR